jgi:uncharacterized membrane protein
MFLTFSRPVPLVLALAFLTFIPVLNAVVNMVQIATDTYGGSSAHLAVAPISWFLHALTGAAFGIAGPMNFALALRRRFGRLHRVTGRIFVGAGAVLGVTAVSLLLSVEPQRTPVIDIARGVFGAALLVALTLAVTAIRARDIPRHRAWAIRAYAIGMGSGTIGLVFLPVYLVTGTPPVGLASDIILVAWWALNIGFAQWVIRRLGPSMRRLPAEQALAQASGN